MLKAYGGMNLILDMVGGSYIQRNLKALADDGRLVQIAFLEGPKVELNMVQMMTRRLTLTCLLYTSPSPRDLSTSRMPSSA